MSRSLAAILLCIALAMLLSDWAAYERGYDAGVTAAIREQDRAVVHDAGAEPDSVMMIFSCAGARPDTAYIWRIHVRSR